MVRRARIRTIRRLPFFAMRSGSLHQVGRIVCSRIGFNLEIYRLDHWLGKESHATSSLPSLAVADCTRSLRIRRNRGMPGTTVPEGVRDQSRHRSAAHGAADAHRHGRLGGLCVAESSGSNDAMRQQLAERPPSNSGAGGHGWRWGSDVDGMAGNYLANVFIERSGRSLKYEAVYLAE